METTATGNFAKTAQALADKAPSGVRSAQDTANDAGNILSSKLEDVRSAAGTVVNKGSRRVQSARK